jgi:hypothetical protein
VQNRAELTLDSQPGVGRGFSSLIGSHTLEHARVFHQQSLDDKGTILLHFKPGRWLCANDLCVTVPGDVWSRSTHCLTTQGGGGTKVTKSLRPQTDAEGWFLYNTQHSMNICHSGLLKEISPNTVTVAEAIASCCSRPRLLLRRALHS